MSYREEVMRNCPSFSTDTMEKKLDLGALGVSGEAGEVAEIVDQVLHRGVDFLGLKDKLVKEMGDVRWYLEYLDAALDINYKSTVAWTEFEPNTFREDFAAAGLRLAIQCGAVTDIIKKVLHHSKPLDEVREKLVEKHRLARIALEFLCAVTHITMEEVEEANVAKLRARHPNGWTPESQNAKADEKPEEKVEETVAEEKVADETVA